jgi:hypothetical protein
MVLQAIAYPMLGLAALIALLNVWLLTRGLLGTWVGRDWPHISIIPVLGQVLAILAAIILFDDKPLFWIAVSVAVLDPGGLHACVICLGIMYCEARSEH